MARKAKPPKEDDSVIAARDRQMLDLAKLDEEENRRIKQMRSISRGVRAFRGVRGSASAARGGVSSPSVGGGGSAAPSVEGQTLLLNHYMSGGR